MKKIYCYIAILLVLVVTFASCGKDEDEVYVDEDGYIVVNGVVTDIVLDEDDVIIVNEDGYVVVNGKTTNIVVDKEDVVGVDENGYIVVNGIKTEYVIPNYDVNHSHVLSGWQGDTATCENSGYKYKKCEVWGCNYREIEATEALGHKFSGNACRVCGVKYSEGLEYKFDGSKYVFVGMGSCTDDEVIFPSEMNGYPVLYEYIDEIYATSITFLNGVSIIPEIYDSPNLTTINIPESVVYVGVYDAYSCPLVTDISVSEKNRSYKSIDGVLYSKDGSVIISYPRAKEWLHFDIPNHVTTIANRAFEFATNLESITLSGNITSVDSGAFGECSFNFNEYNNGYYLGSNNNPYMLLWGVISTDIVEFEIHSATKFIYSYAFEDCSELAEIDIPDSVLEICDYAFYNCNALQTMTIGSGVKSFGRFQYAYAWNSHLRDVYIKDLASWLNITFKSYEANPLNFAENLYVNGELLTSLVIPDDMTRIKANIFAGYEKLYSVTVGKNVTFIEDGAFYNCGNLVEVINLSTLTITHGEYDNGHIAKYALGIHSGESKIHNVDGYLLCTFDGASYLLAYIGNERMLTLPALYNGNKYEIRSCAFRESDIISVVIPEGVSCIRPSAFVDCYDLISVSILANEITIDDYAFGNCRKLIEVINLSTLDIQYGSQDHGRLGYFAKTIHSGESKIVNKNDFLFYSDRYTNYLVGYLGSESVIVLPDDCEGSSYVVGAYSFYQNYNITELVISDGVIAIYEYAFYECMNLEKITFGNNVESIGDNAFYRCGKLISIVFNSGLRCLEDCVFYSCSNITTVFIPDSVYRIGWDVFTGDIEVVFYAGNEDDWNNIYIDYNTGRGNSALKYATIYYYSEEMPQNDGAHWHYVDGVPTIW